MSGTVRSIDVFADWDGLGGAAKMGTLSVVRVRGKEVFSFDYDEGWLLRGQSCALDPELRHFKGPQYPPGDKPNFGIFLDSSPDRWGRLLMRRREGLLARREGRGTRALAESDYLLGVYDQNRMGALRFRERGNPAFQSADTAMAAPPWARLRDLEYATHIVERDGSDEELDPWLAMLMAPGSSLGGARPKASVVDSDGSLWIAKFPGKDDESDVGAWEMLVATLARMAGISMSECRLESLSTRGSTFLTRRFDRTGRGKRTHFASAMTMLGKSDGDNSSTGASYLEIAEFLMRNGAAPDEDLAQLWKRIVFSIAISNTDDHLRNHGFLLGSRGWTLSPAYDLNPSPFGGGLSLCIDENDNALDFDLALSVAQYFRLDAREGKKIRDSVTLAVSGWRDLATRQGISGAEQERMSGAFATR